MNAPPAVLFAVWWEGFALGNNLVVRELRLPFALIEGIVLARIRLACTASGFLRSLCSAFGQIQ